MTKQDLYTITDPNFDQLCHANDLLDWHEKERFVAIVHERVINDERDLRAGRGTASIDEGANLDTLLEHLKVVTAKEKEDGNAYSFFMARASYGCACIVGNAKIGPAMAGIISAQALQIAMDMGAMDEELEAAIASELAIQWLEVQEAIEFSFLPN